MDKILKKTQEDYSIIASHFSEKRRFIWGDLKTFLKLIKPGDRVLDAGCGNGRLYRQVKAKKIDYLGIDFSKELLKIAKKQNPKAKFKNGDLADEKTWQGLKNYDICFCLAVLHHFPTLGDQLNVLEHICKVLKPNGLLVISVWNLWQKRFWKLHLEQVFWKIFKGFKFKWLLVPYKVADGRKIITQVNRFMYCFTNKELENLLKKSGFKIFRRKIGNNFCFAVKNLGQ